MPQELLFAFREALFLGINYFLGATFPSSRSTGDSRGYCDCCLHPEVANLGFVFISLNRFSLAIKAGSNILHP